MEPRSQEDRARRDRFVALVGQVGDPLARYLGRRTTPEEAHDAWADTLLVVWRRLDEVPQDKALPWCYGVARRCLANSRRASTRRLALVRRIGAERRADAGLDGRALDAPSPAPADPGLLAAIASLPERDQELLRLSAWEDLGPSEIAVVLGITPNAVSIRLHRARGRLRDVLNDRKIGLPAEHRSNGHPGEELA